jgi:pimeloyl-ACP methyl ester carboxylesterase
MGEEAVAFDIGGTPAIAQIYGQGRDILYLSAGLWFADESAFIQRLARNGRVFVPIAPGFGAAPADRRWNHVDDLAYLYLDLIDRMKLSELVLVGASFGGWVAAEMAIKSCAAFSSITLIDPLGVKIGDRFTRDIADLFGLPDAELRARAYVDPSVFEADVKKISDDELARRMRAREGLARYGWTPFMHDPKLLSRLRRITVPTQFIWGAHDQIASPDYGRAYASHVPGAVFTQIADAAHVPQVERPQATLDAILSFADAHR